MRGWLIVISILIGLWSSVVSAEICYEKDFTYNPEDPFFLCFATCGASVTPRLDCTGLRIDRICAELCGQAKDDTCTENPINLSNGSKFWSETDFVASGEFPLSIQRYYQSSFHAVDRGFGVNWSAINNLEVNVRRKQSSYDIFGNLIPGYAALTVKRQSGDVIQYRWPDGATSGLTTPDKTNTVETLTIANYGVNGIPQVLWLQYPDRSEEVYEFNLSQYNSAGSYSAQLLWRTNAQGNLLTFARDGSNRLQSITDDTARQLIFHYDANSRVQRIDIPGNQYFRYAYDAIGNLTHVYYPDNTSGNDNDNPFKQYHYENASFPHNLTGITDEEGRRYSTYGYDATGKVSFSELAGGRERIDVISYDDDTVIRNVFGKDGTYHFQNSSTSASIRRQLTGIDGAASSHCDAAHSSNTYDPNGFKNVVTNNRSYATDFNFDTKGRELRREEGLQNTSGTLTQLPETRVTEQEWYTNGLLKEVRAQGVTTNLTYENARVKTATETDTTTQTVPYSTGGTTRVTTNTYTYHDAGQDQIATLSTNGPRTDIASDITATAYDTAGNLLTITTPVGNVTTFSSYNHRGQPETVTDPNGVVTQLTYYPRGWLHTVSIKHPGGNTSLDVVTTFDYYRNGLLQKITFADSSYLTYAYNDAQMLEAIENNLGERVEFGLDLQGNRTSETIKGSDTSIQFSLTRAFDELSRVMDITDSATDNTHITYDVNDNARDITSPKGFLTTQNYDALDRVKNIIQPAVAAGTGQVDFAYDAKDRITSVTDQKDLDTTYIYDGFGNLIQQTSPDTGVTVFYYDKAGNLTQRIDARGVVTNFTYDAENRLLTVSFPADTSENVTYVYDDITLGSYQRGRLSRIIANDNSVAYVYDHQGNVVQETHTQNGISFVLGYQYNLMNQVTEIDYPNGLVVEYGYNNLGRVDNVTGTFNGVTQALASNFDYKPFGPVRQFTYGNGLTRTLTYNLDYELTGINIPGVQNLTYLYDANGNVDYQTNASNTSQNQDFGYDALDRLGSATSIYGTLGYGYDLVGNRTTQTVNSVQDTYQYPADSHRLGSISGGYTASYGYDDIGNTTSRGTDTFAYNLANRMRQATVGGKTVAYRYNPLGERIYKSGSTGAYRYLFSNRQLLVETDGQGNTLKNYVYLNGQRLAIQATNIGNDGFISAFVLSGNNGSYSANTQGLSAESGEPAHAGSVATHSAWFALTPTISGTYQIDTAGSDFDTVLAIYAGNSVSNLTSLASSNNAPNATSSQVYIDLQAGQTYYVAVDGYAGAAGLAQLNLTFIPDTAGNNDIPFLPPWALLLLGSALFGLKGRLNRKAVKMVAFSGLLLSPLVVDYSDIAHADPSPQPVGTVSRWYYVHGDHLDTPQLITDANQAVVWEARYTPFGQATVVVQQIENNLRFPGQYYDVETGLHYNLMRYYDPAIGRYVQSDSIGLMGGLNTFAYVGGNPINAIDPFGLYCVSGNGVTTCFNPGGPTFSLPTPHGFPDELSPDRSFYHLYDVIRGLNNADSSCVLQGLVNNPTPGNPNPASPQGMPNNAVVAGIDNIVRSYLTFDLISGFPIVVNMAGTNDGSLFGPGYVARYIQNGIVHTFGEGTNWKQSPDVSGQWPQDIANELLWGNQMSDLISKCGCEK